MPEKQPTGCASDLSLRNQILDSPEEGWNAFWAAHGSFIRRILARFRLSSEDTEEVQQEISYTLVKDDFKALRAWDPERCSLRGFLIVIATHATINFYRSGYHAYSRRRVVSKNDPSPGEDLIACIESPADTPGERLHRVQLLQFLKKSLDEWVKDEKVGSEDRLLVLLRLRGLSFKEIATVIGITPSHATVRFSRLKPILRKRLEQAGFGYND